MQDGIGVPTWFYERDATSVGAFAMGSVGKRTRAIQVDVQRGKRTEKNQVNRP